LVPLGTAAINKPIVPAPGDYDDGEIGGMMIVRGNRSTRRKPTAYKPDTSRNASRSSCTVTPITNIGEPR
jgi:hypothetical protein